MRSAELRGPNINASIAFVACGCAHKGDACSEVAGLVANPDSIKNNDTQENRASCSKVAILRECFQLTFTFNIFSSPQDNDTYCLTITSNPIGKPGSSVFQFSIVASLISTAAGGSSADFAVL